MTSPYVVNGRSVPRVTEIIRQTLAAPALEHWKLCEVAAYARYEHDAERHGSTGKEIVAAWNRNSRAAADRGTKIHRWIEATITGGQVPGLTLTERPYGRGFAAWMPTSGLNFRASTVELSVTTVRAEVAGTLDFQGWTEDDRPVLCDWKTCSKIPSAPYLEHIVQLGAYASLRYLVHDFGSGRRLPDPEEGFVVYVSPGRTKALRVTLPQAVAAWEHVRFLHLLRSKS